jgi:prepilin-type processing-associated H-X9-DG protein
MQCARNLRQIGRAMDLYAADFDDRFPYAADASDKFFRPEVPQRGPIAANAANMPLLSDVLKPYLGRADAFRCPADVGSSVLDSSPYDAFATSPSMHQEYGSSYFYRTELAFRRAPRASLRRPERVNVLFDACGHWHGGVEQANAREPDTDYYSKVKAYRYTVLFADGHVQAVSAIGLQGAWRSRP